MEMKQNSSDLTPPDCFRLEELEAMRSFENATIQDVHYFICTNPAATGTESPAFLFALLLIATDKQLLFCSGEDSAALRIMDSDGLASVIRHFGGGGNASNVQRLSASKQAIWENVIGARIQAIQLSRHESNLYRNDAVQLDFESQKIVLSLSEREGMALLT